MNRRILAIILLIIFLVLAVTGVVMFLTPFSKSIVSIHTIMGLLTIFFILLHFLNNKRILGLYFSGKGLKIVKRLQPWFIVLVVIVLTAAVYKDLSGFNAIYNWGNEFRSKGLGKQEQTFDWNEYYTKESFPNDTIYSGSGSVGQPSLLYSKTLLWSNLQDQKYFFLDLKGHGHHSGRTGELFVRMDSITSAAQILDRIICSVDAN